MYNHQRSLCTKTNGPGHFDVISFPFSARISPLHSRMRLRQGPLFSFNVGTNIITSISGRILSSQKHMYWIGMKVISAEKPTAIDTHESENRAAGSHPHSFASLTSTYLPPSRTPQSTTGCICIPLIDSPPNKTSNRRHSPVAAADLARSARSFLHPSPPIFTAIIILSS